jgi:hypothetical protein
MLDPVRRPTGDDGDLRIGMEVCDLLSDTQSSSDKFKAKDSAGNRTSSSVASTHLAIPQPFSPLGSTIPSRRWLIPSVSSSVTLFVMMSSPL